MLQPDYNVPYETVSIYSVKLVLDMVCNYLDDCTHARITNKITGEEMSEISDPIEEATIADGDCRLTTYEMAVYNYTVHGYGTTLLTGSKTITLIQTSEIELHDNAVQLY